MLGLLGLMLGGAAQVVPSEVTSRTALAPPVVQAPAGGARGKLLDTKGGAARAFLGLPYAAPPVGALRWKPPAPAAKWTGTRDAAAFGPRCMQPHLFDDMFFRDAGTSEDCLSLNIWTPLAASKSSKLPVMVWIYGGGFVTGSTSEPRQDGAYLATKGVVVVSFNYREGIFGFFTHPDLIAESPAHAAGNYGLMDAVAALQWVRDNIAAFGGDPARVTIFGESAGSFAVSSLMASPMAHGLFARAIGESGGAFGGPPGGGLRYQPAAAQAEKDADWARTQLHAGDLAALRALPAQQLLDAAYPPGGPNKAFGPDIDGSFLPDTPLHIFTAGKQNSVPLLAGWNHDEGGNGRPGEATPTGGASSGPAVPASGDLDRLKEMAAKDFPGHAAHFLEAFPATTDAEALTRLQQYATDKFIAYGTWAWLEAQTDSKAPAYRYRLDLVPPPDPARPTRFGVFHSDDIEYVFGVLDSRKGIAWRPEDYAMSEQMMAYWTNFARNGDPNGKGLPEWPKYTPASGEKVMYLSQPKSGAEKDDLRDQFLFLQAAWGK